jgi:hypothetical protein
MKVAFTALSISSLPLQRSTLSLLKKKKKKKKTSCLPGNDYNTYTFETVILVGIQEDLCFPENMEIGSGKLQEAVSSQRCQS